MPEPFTVQNSMWKIEVMEDDTVTLTDLEDQEKISTTLEKATALFAVIQQMIRSTKAR